MNAESRFWGVLATIAVLCCIGFLAVFNTKTFASINLMIKDEGTVLPIEQYLNFLGAGVTCVDNFAGTQAIDCTIPGGGGGGGTVTSVSIVTSQGISGSVANPTTTPAITLTLGALTGVTSFNGLVVTANTGAITTGSWAATVIPLAFGGTNANLTASNGGIFYSTGSAGAILSGTATARKMLLSQSSSAPIWSTETIAVPGSSGNVLTSDGTNWLSSAPAGGAVRWDQILAPNTTAGFTSPAGSETTLTFQATTQTGWTMQTSTLTTGVLASYIQTSTALTTGTHNVVTIASSGANAAASVVAQGMSISVTNTGTTGTNTALALTASGGVTNYAVDVLAGHVNLLPTTSSTTGVISKDGVRFIHNFALVGTSGANTFVGVNSGNFTMTGSTGTMGSRNTAVGEEALRLNATGSENSALGTYALYANLTGNRNSAVGYSALLSNSSGTGNMAIGASSLKANTTGDANVGIGLDALLANVSGGSNMAIGSQSILNNISGSGNIAVGLQALHDSTNSFNSAIGSYSLYSTTGASNIAIGYASGYSITTGSTNITIGNYPTFATGITTGSSNITIGENLQLQTATSSNQLNIGNLLFATGLGSGTTLSTGFIGIGDVAPSARLTVTHVGTTTNAILGQSSTLTTGKLLSLVSTSTALPTGTQTLNTISVSGANAAASVVAQGLAISVTNTGTTGTNTALTLTASGATNNRALTTTVGKTLLGNIDLGATTLNVYGTVPAGTALAAFQAAGLENGSAVISTAGDVDAGAIYAFNASHSVGYEVIFRARNTHATGAVVFESLVASASAGDAWSRYGVNGGQNWSIGLDNSAAQSFKISSATTLGTNDYLTILASGFVGIGNTAPSALLTVGAAGGTTGKINLLGTTSGTVSITTAAAAGTWTLQLPANDGNANDVLRSDGSGVTTWAPVAAVVGSTDFRQGVTTPDGAPVTIYTATNGTSVLRVTATIFATAFTSGTATYTVAWTQNGTAQTLAVTSLVLNTLGSATAMINPDNGTAVTAQLTGIFVATETVTGTVEQLK